MTVVVCDSCGANYTLASDFELDGPCSECGEVTLSAEDPYDAGPRQLTCTTCGREVDGGRGTSARADDEDYAGRYSVDDPCPLCGGELVPRDDVASPRALPEFRLARAVAAKARAAAGQHSLPVNPEVVARSQGLQVSYDDHGEGALTPGVIHVPARESPRAQRWAIAHELGHALLRHDVPSNRIEKEANAFASELLIPRKELRRLIDEGVGYRRLAGEFDVSREALGWAVNQARLAGRISGP